MEIPVSGMAPLLQVFDMPVSLAFYRDLLGFQVIDSSGTGDDVDWVLLGLGRTELMLNTAYGKLHRPAEPNSSRNAIHADMALYFGCPDPDAAYQVLYDKGWDVRPAEVTAYGMKQLSFLDPDGYAICLQWPATLDRQREWEERYGVLNDE